MPAAKKPPAKSPAKKRASAKKRAPAEHAEPVPVVYITRSSCVLAGPKHAFKVGQEVTVPRREVPWPHNVTYPEYEGVVTAVEPDGLSRIIPKGMAPE